MAKKKTQKAALYVEIPLSLKKRLDRLAELRRRKLTAEVTIALERYAEAEEEVEGIEPPDDPKAGQS